MFGRMWCWCRGHPRCSRKVQRGSERGLMRLGFVLASLPEPKGQLRFPPTQHRRLLPGLLGTKVGVGRAQLHPSSAAVAVVIDGPHLAAGRKHAEPEVGELRVNVLDHRSAARALKASDGRFNQVYFHHLTSLCDVAGCRSRSARHRRYFSLAGDSQGRSSIQDSRATTCAGRSRRIASASGNVSRIRLPSHSKSAIASRCSRVGPSGSSTQTSRRRAFFHPP
jgi:hypothetical protein